MKKGFGFLAFSILACVGFAQDCSTFNLNITPGNYWYLYNFNGELLDQGATPEQSSFCVQNGCFQLNVESLAMNPQPLEVSVSDANGNPIQMQNQGDQFYFVGIFSNNGNDGCLDPSACNYDPTATCYDYSLCDYSCLGCTNPNAFNYNPSATQDNGTCCTSHWATFTASEGNIGVWLYSQTYYMTGGDNLVNNQFCLQDGCYSYAVYPLDSATSPSQFQITLEDGSVWISGNVPSEIIYLNAEIDAVQGCADPNACNYLPNATCNDGSCEYASCQGCTDPNATNFDPNAIYDNGKCCFGDIANINTSVPSTWSIQNSLGYYQYGYTPADSTLCLYPGCYTLNAYPNEFDPLNPDGESTYIIITDSLGNVVSEGMENSFQTGIPYTFIWGTVIPGCTEPSACNYNPEATCGELANCDYSCQGCTDPNASNFNANATVDNNTCCYSNWYTIEASSWTEWYVSSSDGLYQQGGYTGMQNGFCMDQSCFSLNAWSLNVEPFNLTIFAPDGSVFFQTNNNPNPFITEYFSFNEIVGCTDPFACNFNPNATCANYELCDYSCFGCTNATAPNFNPNATVDDGSCCATEDWNTITSDGQVVFYAFNPSTGEGDFNEFPYATGYCMNATNCYQLVLYSFEPNNSEVIVTNAQGNVVLNGNLADFGYLQAFVSGGNEVAGCTDPLACNYDSTATCDVGNCMYYCGGCVDPLAANFNTQALYDDGSCVYSTDLPNMGMMLMEDPANSQFYVLMDLASMGTGGPYGVVSSLNEPTAVMSAAGQTMKGPYACGTEVQFTVHDMGNNMQTAMTSPIYTMACGVNVEETPTKKSELQVYPNPAKNNVQLTGIEKGTSVEIYDLTGRVVFRDKATTNKMEISISKWNAGIYLVRAGEKTVRLVKD
jgi:Secretion system C-terminal sorting domain